MKPKSKAKTSGATQITPEKGSDLTSLLNELEAPPDNDEEEAEDAPIIRLISLMILEAYRTNAKKIDIIPQEGKPTRLVYDGKDVEPMPDYLYDDVRSRIRLIANIYDRKRTGTIEISAMGRELSIRVKDNYGKSIEMTFEEKEVQK